MSNGVGPSGLQDKPMPDPELDPPFDVVEPTYLTSPLVFSSPHSGSIYPRRFLDSARLDAVALRRSEDAFVDELFAGVGDLGAPLIRARFPRAYLDLNREPYELDPRMFDGRLPGYREHAIRSGGERFGYDRPCGRGSHRRFTPAPLSIVEEGLARIETAIQAVSRDDCASAHRSGTVTSCSGWRSLIDCHSMPSVPALSAA